MDTQTIRQIVLDTETTGMNMSGPPHDGHRIIEIGAVEIINRRLTGNHFHVYLKPDRAVDPEAFKIHGISDKFLADKPEFSDIAKDFVDYIRGATLVIHNASFDVGFLNHEFSLVKREEKIEKLCEVIDTLTMARERFPGKRNSLDALCSRYKIDNSKRILHGALLDAEILADVFLTMTGGQTSLMFSNDESTLLHHEENIAHSSFSTPSKLRIVNANKDEIDSHKNYLEFIEKKNGQCGWK